MIVYHEVSPDAVESILQKGLKRKTSGSKTDSLVGRTDDYLDSRIPEKYAGKGISRSNNNYGFVVDGDEVIDIYGDQRRVSTTEYVRKSEQAVLALDVDPARCYVSDLDAYDAVKEAVDQGFGEEELAQLATAYWDTLVPLEQFEPDSIKRPEVMITYDVEPAKISVVKEAG